MAMSNPSTSQGRTKSFGVPSMYAVLETSFGLRKRGGPFKRMLGSSFHIIYDTWVLSCRDMRAVQLFGQQGGINMVDQAI